MHRHLVWALVALVILCGCGVPAEGGAAPTPSIVAHHPGVADLWRHPPAPMTSGEVDAYFSGLGGAVGPGPVPAPGMVVCPAVIWDALLADRPFRPFLQILNGMVSNALPDDAPWLIATTPEQLRPGKMVTPELPYHARLRGHFGEPAFARCDRTSRIFVVEGVVRVYEQQPPDRPAQIGILTPPAQVAGWPRHHDPKLGYGLPYPPDWTVEPLDAPDLLSAVALRAPGWPGYPVVVRVHDGETHYDQYNPALTPPLLRGLGFGVLDQAGLLPPGSNARQTLAGYSVERGDDPAHRTVAALFSAHGRTYELVLRYPLGFDAPQPLLTGYTAIVAGFRLDAPPAPTPSPAIKRSVAGTLLSRDAAANFVVKHNGPTTVVLDARLTSEAEARAQATSCKTFDGHPDGVWVFTVRGPFEGMPRTMRLLLDARSGEQLCGEEIDLRETPRPALPPGATEMPVLPTVTPISRAMR